MNIAETMRRLRPTEDRERAVQEYQQAELIAARDLIAAMSGVLSARRRIGEILPQEEALFERAAAFRLRSIFPPRAK